MQRKLILFTDIIDFFANGGRIIKRWGDGEVAKELDAIGFTKVKAMELHKYDGKSLYKDPWYHRPQDAGLQFAGHRGAMHSVIFRYAERLGVTMKTGTSVIDYRETTDKSGVVLEGGEEIWGDVVIAADGARSLARDKVLGLKDQKTSSGWAIYRAFYETTPAMRENPLLKDYTDPDKETIRIWISNSATMLGYGWNSGKNIAWVMMHKVSLSRLSSELGIANAVMSRMKPTLLSLGLSQQRKKTWSRYSSIMIQFARHYLKLPPQTGSLTTN